MAALKEHNFLSVMLSTTDLNYHYSMIAVMRIIVTLMRPSVATRN